MPIYMYIATPHLIVREATIQVHYILMFYEVLPIGTTFCCTYGRSCIPFFNILYDIYQGVWRLASTESQNHRTSIFKMIRCFVNVSALYYTS